MQDSDGNWWYFYWGPDNPDINILFMILNTPEICVYMMIPTYGCDMTDFGSVIKAIGRMNDYRRVGEQASEITSALYFEGDYSATHEFLAGLKLIADVSDIINYSLLFMNCSQMSAYAMSQSNQDFSFDCLTVPLVPNFTYDLLRLKGKHKKEMTWTAYEM